MSKYKLIPRMFVLIGLASLLLTGCEPEKETIEVGCYLNEFIAAINTANADEDADVIQFIDPGCILTLDEVNNQFEVEGFTTANGLPVITTPITIRGDQDQHVRLVRIDVAPEFRFFTVASTGSLTLEYVDLSGGSVHKQTYASGGGIQNGGGTLNLIESDIQNCSADHGGAIANSGSLMIENSTVMGNSAGSGGGVINISDGVFTLSNSLVKQNAAEGVAGGGGGIANMGSLNVVGSRIEDNSSLARGGGLYNIHGQVLISASVIENNQAVDGGGIYNYQENDLIIDDNSQILANIAEGNGGGVYNDLRSTLTIHESLVQGNEAAHGGGIRNLGNMTISDSTIENNQASSTDGGGLLESGGGNTFLERSTLSGNSALQQGSALYTSGRSTTITNVTVSGNTTSEGFALFLGGSVSISNSTIANNIGGGYRSGGIEVSGSVEIKNSIVANNSLYGCTINSQASFITSGENLADDASCTGFSIFGDPMLTPLQDNGGPTYTHGLRVGSPAIDSGSPAQPGSAPEACEPVDQRGVSRPDGPYCDVGAYEGTAYFAYRGGSPYVTFLKSSSCRFGPDTNYHVVAFFEPEDTAPVIGRNEAGDWWQVYPDEEGQTTCWVSDNVVSRSFSREDIPMGILPPLPTLPPATRTPVLGCWVKSGFGASATVKCVSPCPKGAVPGGVCKP